MMKDVRYKNLKNLLEGGHIKTFQDMLDTVPKTTIASDLSMHHETLDKYLAEPGRFTYNRISEIAVLIGTDFDHVHKLVMREFQGDKKARKKP